MIKNIIKKIKISGLLDNLFSRNLDQDNHTFIKWDNLSTGCYENWYCIVNHLTKPIAFWFRYTLIAYTDDRRPEGCLWAIMFDKNCVDNNFILTTPININQIQFNKQPFSVNFGNTGCFSNGRVVGKHKQDDLNISWDFSFKPSSTLFRSVSSRLLESIISSSHNVSPNNNIRYNGNLIVNDQVISFNDAPGHQGHTWGEKMQQVWVWCHCNMFKNDPNAVFEGVSIKKENLKSPLSSLYLRYRGQDYFFNTIKHIITNVSSFDVGLWRFFGVCGNIKIEGEFRPNYKHTHYVKYIDVDGDKLFNRNSCLGRGNIKVFRSVNGHWKLETNLVAEDTVAFEYVDRNKDDNLYLPHTP